MPGVRRYHESFEDTFVRQTEWVEGRGLLLVLAMYAGGIGSATFLLGSFFDAPGARIAGWLLAVVGKGTLHIAYLGRPARFWRALARPHSSWISRGIWVLGVFAIMGGADVLVALSGSRSGLSLTVSWLAAAAAAFLLTYDGFLVRAAIGLHFWRGAFMPVLFPLFGLLAGSGLFSVLGLVPASPAGATGTLEALDRVLLVACTLTLVLALAAGSRRSEAGRSSVVALLRGDVRWFFWGGVIAVTIVLPLAAVGASLLTRVPIPLLGAVALLSVAGEFFFKYSVLKAGIYQPLVPREMAGDWFAQDSTR